MGRSTAVEPSPSPPESTRRLCRRFHQVGLQLGRTQRGREPFPLDDEYDVQDLLHALLRLHFDDIRPEEWTPSYAGSPARVDFLLKAERIVIEVKSTRDGLADRQLGKQLIEDVAHYRFSQDCGQQVCFIYDPEQRVCNPIGLSRDIESQCADGFGVVVLIGPQR